MNEGSEGILALAELFKAGVILACLAGVWYVYLRFTIQWRSSERRLFIVGIGLPILAGGAAFLILRNWKWGLAFATPLVFPVTAFFSKGISIVVNLLIPEPKRRER